MRTRRYHVIGDPIEHSLSPILHRAAFRTLDLPHTYDAMRVTKEELPRVLDRVRRGEIHGLNVTVPHKVEALRLCDLFTDEVGTTGAVNTVFLDATGRLVGSNTDVDGFRADLLAHGVVPTRALVLGAGGGARAVVAALRTLSSQVTVAARDAKSAQLLCQTLGFGEACALDSLEGVAPFDLIVNATSAGMRGGPDGAPIGDAWARAPKRSNAAAYDLVYRPEVTPFLERARSDGARAISGLGMLVEQGARALAIFLGMPIEGRVKQAMREAVTAALG